MGRNLGRTSSRGSDFTLLLVIAAVALNLRNVLAAVGPLLPEIRAELGLSEVEAGALSTLPVLCFAVAAPLGSALVRRVGPEWTVVLGLAMITLATASRSRGGPGLMLAGTLVIGAGITLGNVVIPAIVKRDLPHRTATATSVFTANMCIGAAAAAGLTPVAAELVGWRWALSLWAILALAALSAWIVLWARRRPSDRSRPVPAGALGVQVGVASRRLFVHPVAWAVAVYLGAQSCNYFSLTTWLSTYLVEEVGATARTGGVAMSVFQLLGILGSMATVPLARLGRNQVPLAVGVSLGWAVTVLGLMVVPTLWPMWTVVGGVTQGAGITVSMMLIVLRAGGARAAELLSGMVQFIGYGMGAVAPVVVGALRGATGSWHGSWMLLLGTTALMGLVGSIAGREKTLDVLS